jgi:integrase/recombinase XerD
MTVGPREPLVSLAAGLAEELDGHGYTPDCIARHVRLLHRLDEWMEAEGLGLGELTAAEVERFVQTGRAAGQPRWPSQRGLAPLLSYLRRAGVVPMPPAPVAATSVERIVACYRRWLVEERSLAAPTVEDYERYVRVFFSQLAEPVQGDLSGLSAAEVTAAVRAQCRSRSVGWARNFNTALWSLLRFFLDGHSDVIFPRVCCRWPAGVAAGCPRRSTPKRSPGCSPAALANGAPAGGTWRY